LYDAVSDKKKYAVFSFFILISIITWLTPNHFRYIPNFIKGDLDSVHSDVLQFYKDNVNIYDNILLYLI